MTQFCKFGNPENYATVFIWDYEDGGGATTTIEAQFGMEEEEEADNAG